MAENGIMSGTGQGLLDFLTYVSTKGLLNKNTAGALRGAAKELLLVDNTDLTSIDVRQVDVDDLGRRFANLRAGKYTPKSLETYQSRFRTAVEVYLRYLANPAGWRPEIRERAPSSSSSDHGRSRPAAAGTDAPMPPPPSTGMIQYPFPIRKDVIASLTLPADLRGVEAKRLAAFLDSLAVEEPRGLPAGSPSKEAG